jgi:agmatine/peptidylarginine deiminase
VQFLDAESIAIADFDGLDAPDDAARMDVAIETIERAARVLGIDLNVYGIHVPVDDSGLYYEYVNSLRLGDVVLVPSYSSAPAFEEEEAFADWQAALPRAHIVPVPAQDLWDAQGGVHCAALGLHLGRTS